MGKISHLNLLTFVFILILGLSQAFVALALQPSFSCPPGLRCSIPGGDSAALINGLVLTAINWLLGFVFSLAVLFLIIGGFWYIISAGNAESAEKARATVINALIGIVIVILSYAIISVVVNTISGGGPGGGIGP